MDHRRTEKYFTIVSPGLEEICATELKELGLSCLREEGGISFSGKLRDLYQANLHLRTASRILVRFAEIQSRDFPDLYRKALKLPWGRFIRPEMSVSFRITCRESRLNHTRRISETLESAINQALGRGTNPEQGQSQLIMVRIIKNQVVFSIDSSGELLHRRGYRQSATKAPLRETLAAGILMLLDWKGEIPMTDPMCGSGSFPLEAGQIACKRAPGLNRHYAFMEWPGYREGLWTLLCDEAQRRERDNKVTIIGADKNNQAISAATNNHRQGGNFGQVTFITLDLNKQKPHKGFGLVVCNPPYGKRLGLGNSPEAFYRDLGTDLQHAFPGWRKALVCPDNEMIKATGLPFNQLSTLDNGGLNVGLFVAEP